MNTTMRAHGNGGEPVAFSYLVGTELTISAQPLTHPAGFIPRSLWNPGESVGIIQY